IAFADKASKYLPALAGSSFDNITLLDLATFTAGGLPLQFPGGVTDRDKMIAYFRTWRPVHPPGAYRLYSNPSIGLFGDLAARSMGKSFDELMAGDIFPALGLANTFVRVPKSRMRDYAVGYWKGDKPIRVAPGMFDSEAYGVKTSASDSIRFVQANVAGLHLDKTMQDAVAATHTGYYTVEHMTQGLAWEMYDYPTDLQQLLAGNTAAMAFDTHKVRRLVPPRAPRPETLINKTGSTNGFGAYVAFIPARRIGIAILANRNFPIPARVEAAYRILTALKT
ncbi:MAG TPA: class C beta-lactamase, partial [Pseudolabrys sp.]|nr:class C beta-lactamase [Pseudolabrys sp.]